MDSATNGSDGGTGGNFRFFLPRSLLNTLLLQPLFLFSYLNILTALGCNPNLKAEILLPIAG